MYAGIQIYSVEDDDADAAAANDDIDKMQKIDALLTIYV